MTDHGPAAPITPIFRARIEPGGAVIDAPAQQPLLLSAAAAGIGLPNSCRNGSCRACICRLLEGRVAYSIAWPGVLPEEKAQGFILPCVAYPQSDVVLQFECLP